MSDESKPEEKTEKIDTSYDDFQRHMLSASVNMQAHAALQAEEGRKTHQENMGIFVHQNEEKNRLLLRIALALEELAGDKVKK